MAGDISLQAQNGNGTELRKNSDGRIVSLSGYGIGLFSKIKVDKNIRKKIKKKNVLVGHKRIKSIKYMMIIDKRVS